MAHMLARFKVESYPKWRTAFNEHESIRKEAGALSAQVFRSGDDPFEIFVLMEWDELERARQFAVSEELRQAMQEAGVSGPPDISFMHGV